MYLGKLVEIGEAEEVYKNPIHPYTKALLSSIPIPDPDLYLKAEREILLGDVPSPLNPPSGCRFRTRCKYATERCKEEEPIMRQMINNHSVACHVV
ncbi:Dipeptide transport ATP-binding protein DppD [bioreactor metagenome]|uniref:Dipeptide transport ATP-binding protein DppD n=1 Tax=bioreactor metagenome TaxID=1076179 RepID=A0A644ZJE4_9ZZZZ